MGFFLTIVVNGMYDTRTGLNAMDIIDISQLMYYTMIPHAGRYPGCFMIGARLNLCSKP